MNWLDFIIGIIAGANLVWLFYQFKKAPLLVDWHQIGRTFQRTYHFKDQEFREGGISEN